MNNPGEIYRRAAMAWGIALTLIFGLEVFFLLALVTGRPILAGILSALVTVVLLCVTALVWSRLPEEADDRLGSSWGAEELPPYLVLGSKESDKVLRRLLDNDPQRSRPEGQSPWSEEIEALHRNVWFRRGNPETH